jgi:hypothetical protein
MGELGERRWAVISERGCEASSLTHTEALEMMRRLVNRKAHGVCVVTNEAASRIANVEQPEHAAPQPIKTHSKA